MDRAYFINYFLFMKLR